MKEFSLDFFTAKTCNNPRRGHIQDFCIDWLWKRIFLPRFFFGWCSKRCLKKHSKQDSFLQLLFVVVIFFLGVRSPPSNAGFLHF